MTGDFAKPDMNRADGKLDPVQESARWPEWGVERWEETDRAEDSPVASIAVADAGQLRRNEEILDSREFDQSDPPNFLQAPNAKINRSFNVTSAALAITACLLLAGGYFYESNMSWAGISAARSAPPASRGTASMDAGRVAALTAPSKTAAQPSMDISSPNASISNVPELRPDAPEVAQEPVAAKVSEPKPAIRTERPQLTNSHGLMHRVSQRKQPAQSVPDRACVHVYPQLGRCR